MAFSAGEDRLGVRIARWLLLAAVALAPLVVARLIGAPPVTHDVYELPKDVVVRCLAAGAMLAWSVAFMRSGRLRWSWWLAPLGVYALWISLATTFSPSPATSFLGMHGRLLGLASTLSSVAIGFLAFQVFHSSSHLKPLARTMLVSGSLVSLLGALQVVHLDPFFYFPIEEFPAGRVFSTLGNPVFLGGYLALLIPIALTLALLEESPWWKTLAWSTVALAFVALVGTETRSAWIVVAVELVLFTVVMLRKRVPFKKVDVLASVITVGLVAAEVMSTLSSNSRYLNAADRVTTLLSGSDGSTIARAAVMFTALRAVATRPLFGFGPDREGVVFKMFLTKAEAAKYASYAVDNAHSVPLQIAATAGVVAVLAWLACVSLPLWGDAWSTFSSESSSGRVLLAGLWVAMAGYALFMLVGIQVAGARTVFWAFLGVLAGATAREVVVPHKEWGALLVGASTLAVVGALVFGAVLVTADHAYMEARLQVRGYASGDPVASAKLAARLSPWDITYLREVWIVTDSRDVAAQRAALDRALAVEPDDIESLWARRALAITMGDPRLAATLMRRIEADAPDDPATIAAESSSRS
jgi:O-antigen ligase